MRFIGIKLKFIKFIEFGLLFIEIKRFITEEDLKNSTQIGDLYTGVPPK